jgi:diketogulonate reductase-like aldo/keto reductase
MGTWNMGSTSSEYERTEQVRALRRGIELGMNLIDTAESYGAGRSEEFVAEAVRDVRESVFIATKVSGEHLHYDDLIASCERSLRRLGTKYIDLYQIHWPNSRIPIRETMTAMEKLVREGKVRYIGVSNFGVQELREAQDALTSSELVSNQVEYSMTSRSIEDEILPYCEKEGITIIAYSPLAHGNIPRNAFPNEVLDRYHATPAETMLAWVVRRQSVIAIPKAASVEHVEENATSDDLRISEKDYDLLSKSIH